MQALQAEERVRTYANTPLPQHENTENGLVITDN